MWCSNNASMPERKFLGTLINKSMVMIATGGQRSASRRQRGAAVRQAVLAAAAHVPASLSATVPPRRLQLRVLRASHRAMRVQVRFPAPAFWLPYAMCRISCLNTRHAARGLYGSGQMSLRLCFQAAQGEDAVLGRSASSGGTAGGQQRLRRFDRPEGPALQLAVQRCRGRCPFLLTMH